MSSTTPTCRACHRILAAGEALRVVPVSGFPLLAPFAIHRPGIVGACIRAAGKCEDARIEMFDPTAAIAFDRAGGGPRDNGATFEAQARARNLEISAAKPRYEEE